MANIMKEKNIYPYLHPMCSTPKQKEYVWV